MQISCSSELGLMILLKKIIIIIIIIIIWPFPEMFAHPVLGGHVRWRGLF